MPTLTPAAIQRYRARVFRSSPSLRIASVDEAVRFVEERGFVYFWPIKEVVLPSLWVAAAGDRPVADAHDDPGHKTWGWKDALLGQRRWYYGKILRKKSTMIALAAAPYFYALSENYGSLESDYLLNYERGLLSPEAKAVYETLLREGPTDSVALRKATGLAGEKSAYRFERALLQLESDFKILPTGVTRAGAWRYAFLYDIVARHYPELPEQARHIRASQARLQLLALYLRSVGAARLADAHRLFGWPRAQVEQAAQALAETGGATRGLSVAGQPGEWIAVDDALRP